MAHQMTTLLELTKLKEGNSFKYKDKVMTVKWIQFIHVTDVPNDADKDKWLGLAVEPNDLGISHFSFGYPDLNLKLAEFDTQ